MRYLKFDPVSKIIIGNQTTPDGDITLPGWVKDPDGALYAQAQALYKAGALYSMIIFDSGEVTKTTDPRKRIKIDVVTDKPTGPGGEHIIVADGISTATLTFTVINSNGDTVNFNGRRILDFFDSRLLLANFVNGVFVKTFTTTESGYLTINRTEKNRIQPITIVAVEI